MPRILIVEDSRSFASLLSGRIKNDLGFKTVVADSLAAAMEIIGRDTAFLAALVDINLPDAPDGEAVDLLVATGLPVIVFTGQMSDELREEFWRRRIADYVLKDSRTNIDYVLRLLSRLEKNPATKVLVVDDSRSFRFAVITMLTAHRYQVLEASGGREALKMLAKHPDLRLMIVDSSMPDTQGAELVRQVRKRHGKDQLAVIGVSGTGEWRLSAKFLKAGANDFLTKPFQAEEFYTRVTQNLEMLEHMAQIREMAERDFLTHVYNRRHFFTSGEKLLALLSRKGQPCALAMLDIDHFKAINDTFGHEAGDEVLKQMARLLSSRFRASDIVARLGGEEFCVLASGMAPAAALLVFEELRRLFEGAQVCYQDRCLSYTVSIGLCCRQGLGLEEMLREADALLYRAKAEGRNRVVVSPAPD